MYSKIQILANISKFSKCEESLIENIIKQYKKGNLNSSYKSATSYFILKDLIAKNECFQDKNSIVNMYDKIQDICNKCEINFLEIVTDDSLIEFGIITENGIQIYSENNNALIQE
jgi:hypothetical protein